MKQKVKVVAIIVAVLAVVLAWAVACSPDEDPPKRSLTYEEIMATLEALPPAPTPDSKELALREETRALWEQWWAETAALMEQEYSNLSPTPTPDPRYKGCYEAVQAYHVAWINYREPPGVAYLSGTGRETLEAEYFEALTTLGKCLGQGRR